METPAERGELIYIVDGGRKRKERMMAYKFIAIGMGIGFVIGALLTFFIVIKTAVSTSHFAEKLYVERQAALAMAAEATNAYNLVGGKRHNKNRRIITPAEFDARVGNNIGRRAKIADAPEIEEVSS